MIEFPMAVNQPEVAERLIRALDLKGDQPQLLDGYFQVGVSALDLEKPEYAWLRRSQCYIAGGSPATGAATFSGVAFTVNPGGTGNTDSTLAVVKRLRIYNFNAAAQNFFLSLTAVPGAGAYVTLAGRGPADLRVAARPGGTSTSRFQLWGGNPAAAIGTAGALVGLAAGGSIDLGPFILVDRSGYTNPPMLLVEAAGANVGFHVFVEWLERPVLQSELNA